ncbi:MAG: hypothetical protein F4139_11640 [Gemmatimonadetes bacterium]|nr:hypothetical protein [Gemmatimonadota bacterium]MYA63338.1 hypothetical protein [Gemmatimonadota bacterium]MYB97518.1 hypothetical protein [Gemmatimonadota bacterium]MYH53574.1 hypothetical protein [Gemmatimonadota bacterium]MYI45753.1 hypothetical protein [Gemmatimonadota bacterium]
MSTTKKQPSYTARELEEETGFDRRTIAYYVQEGLLPRVGRRGPRTRYPRLVRDRLLFIRRVREAEEVGEVTAVSLSDMRKVFERVPPALIAKVADGGIAVTPELVERTSTRFRLPAMRRAMLEERVRSRDHMEPPSELQFMAAPRPPSDPGWAEVREAREMPREVARPEEDDHDVDESETAAMELADALGQLQDRARRRERRSSRPLDTWTRVAVTPEIELSVRGVTDEDRGLLERVRGAMMRLLGMS